MSDGLPAVSLAGGHKDRHVGLIVVGAFVVMIGCACGVMAVLAGMMIDSVGLAPELGRGAPTLLTAVFGSMSVVLIWLGVGSILIRRWARTLLWVVSGWWLAGGGRRGRRLGSRPSFVTGVVAMAWGAVRSRANASSVRI